MSHFSTIWGKKFNMLIVHESCSILDWTVTTMSKSVTSRPKAEAKAEILNREESKKSSGRILGKKVSEDKRMRRMRKR